MPFRSRSHGHGRETGKDEPGNRASGKKLTNQGRKSMIGFHVERLNAACFHWNPFARFHVELNLSMGFT